MAKTLDQIKTIKAIDSLQTRVPTLGLTIMLHPSIDRVGEIARLTNLGSGERVNVNRMEPVFHVPSGGTTESLATPFVSRKSLLVEATRDGSVRLSVERGADFSIGGTTTLENVLEVHQQELKAGVVLVVGNAVVLLLHFVQLDVATEPTLGFIGESAEIRQLRANIRRVADLDVPVLLRGETGVGKELVASAIHECSQRREKQYVCVNMAAIASTVAASELFGHTKGAFTGADRAHLGYFQRAHGGTLFFDEIGDVAQEIQPMLLRAVEAGQVQAVGGDRPQTVDVRIIAATDSNLEHAIKQGDFRLPLLQRLAGYEVHVPPLRARRDDIGRLFVHFMREEMKRLGESWRLSNPEPEERGWLRASLMARLALYKWPGNVRQLRNVTRQLAISNRGAPKFRLDATTERLLSDDGRQIQGEFPVQEHKRPRASSAISDDTIIRTLRENRCNVSATATALDVSRTWLFTRMDRCDKIRKASDLGKEEIVRCRDECGGDLDEMVARLEVSKHGLKQRMTQLGIR